MRRFYILGLILMSFCFDGVAQYDPQAKEILDRVSNKYSKMNAFKADFNYKLENKEADINEKMKGTIYIKDDQFKLELLSKIIFFDGDLIREYDSDFEEYTIREYDSEEEEINLSSVMDLYKDGFKYYVREQNADGYVIELQPEDRTKSFFKILMNVDTNSNIKSFTYFEKNGNLVTTEITGFKELPSLSNSFFDFFKAGLNVVDSVDMTDRF